MKVRIDESFCSGTGVCVQMCPEVFEFNEDGFSTVKVDKVPAELEQTCRDAAENCPTNAIRVEE